MPKKRNCRRNEQEKQVHEQAVALRKLTDQQLIDRIEQKYTAGYEAGKREAKPIDETPRHLTEQLLLALSLDVKGIGPALIAKMRPVIQGIVDGRGSNE